MTQLYEAARAYLGTPWLKGGRTKEGVDCLTHSLCAAKDIGVDADPWCMLSYTMPVAALVRAVATFIDEAGEEPLPNYIAIWRISNATHQGIIAPGINGPTVVYAKFNHKVIEEPFDPYGLSVRRFYKLRSF